MGWGVLSQAQLDALRPLVAGRHVTDLGAGDLELTKTLVDLGAAHVVAVDKERLDLWPWRAGPKVTLQQHRYFHELPALKGGVAFTSFPPNYTSVATELVRIVQGADVLVYVGSNVSPTACAKPLFFAHTLARELLAEVPGPRQQTLLALGKVLPAPRTPTLEERYGLGL